MGKKSFTKAIASLLTTSMLIGSIGVLAGAEPLSLEERNSEFSQKTLDEITAEKIKTLNYNRPTVNAVGTVSNVDEVLGGAVLPSVWDSRKALPAVRDQLDWGLCWSFATVGNVEISAVNAGLADTSIDLSEYFEGYIGQNYSGKYTNGDYQVTSKNTATWASNGYYYVYGMYTLMNWYGAVSEEDEPYNTTGMDTDDPELPTNLDEISRDQYHISGFRLVPRSQPQLVKQAIIDSGCVSMGYNADSGKYKSGEYNGQKIVTYYNSNTEQKGANHDVIIIGWDDNIPAELFVNKNGEHPTSDGGWIVRNSWGTEWSGDGYFYISYEELSVDEALGQILIDTKDNYDNNYQYEAPMLHAAIQADNKLTMSNVFDINKNSGGAEEIAGVAFYVGNTDCDYSIQLYKFDSRDDFKNTPNEGEALLSQPIKGKSACEGYYSEKLDKPILVDEGEVVAVVVDLSKEGETILVYEEYPTIDFDGGVNRKFVCVSNPGESYICDNEGWVDVSTGEIGEETSGNIAVKLYTNNTTEIKDQARNFVKRLYRYLLGREADNAGLKHWTSSIKSDTTAIELIKTFVSTKEFAEKNYKNEDIVKLLYNAMLDRDVDDKGLKNWVEKLDNGESINAIISGIAGSPEFDNLCKKYGIIAGTATDGEARDKNPAITAFVSRCYTEALGRSYDVDGINYWCDKILSAKDPKAEAKLTATNGFFHSEEFKNKNTTNEEYVEILYRTFLGREYDTAGKADWVERLNKGTSRDEVLAGFSDSVEFSNIMAKYGL